MSNRSSVGTSRAAHAIFATAIVVAIVAYRVSIQLIDNLRESTGTHPLMPVANWLEIAIFVGLMVLIWLAFRNWQAVVQQHEKTEAAHTETSQLLAEVQKKYAQLKELEELRDNLTYMIVHDLKTPLTAVSGYLDILKRYSSAKLDEKERGFLLECSKQTHRLANMITSVLDVTKLESNQLVLNMEPTDLHAVCVQASEMLSNEARKIITIEALQGPIIAYCDTDVVRRVCQNLMDNAAKFSPSDEGIKVVLSAENSHAKMSVTDHGPGIPAEFHSKIFERFGRLKASKYSTGLGLTFCKLAIEAHGGRIGVVSEQGKGSTFWFTLPAKPPVK